MSYTEIAVIGSCLADRQAFDYAIQNITQEYFCDINCRRAFILFQKAVEKGIPVDSVTISSLTEDADLKGFIFQCAIDVPSSLTIKHYIDLVKKDYFKRTLSALFSSASKDPENKEIKEAIEKTFGQMQDDKTNIIDFGVGLQDYLELIEKRSRGEIVSTTSGYPNFDKLTCGFINGDSVVVGARTSKGKSAFLINLSKRYFERGERVLYISSEMIYSQIMDRLMSLKTGIGVSKLRWHPGREDVKSVMKASNDFSKNNFIVYEGSFLNIHKISSIIKSQKPTVVIVDYIQGFIQQGRHENRSAFYSWVAYALKAMAKEQKVVIISASQLNRQSEHADREPTLADLKESGGIEEAADTVILLHQKTDNLDGSRIYDFIIPKSRNGPTGRVEFIYFEKFTRFEEYESGWQHG